MIIKQISAFVENKPGRLAEIIDILAKNSIDMRALSIADTTDFGILRVIVDKPEEVAVMLRENKVTVSMTDVLAVKLKDKPGSLAELLKVLAAQNISVEYLYAFVAKNNDDSAYVVIRVDDNDATGKLLEQNGYEGVYTI